MFAQIFESAPPPYRVPADVGGVPHGIGLGSLYNGYLVTPPRFFAEDLYSIGFIIGVFVNKEGTPDSPFTIHLMSSIDTIYWPGYDFGHWVFDGMTGAFLRRDTTVTNALYGTQVLQARDGSLWVTLSPLSSFYEADPLTLDPISGSTVNASHFGAITVQHPMVDKATGLVVLRTNNEASNQIGVYQFASGALVRRVNISGTVLQVFPEDATRCYVLSDNGILNLIDFSTGVVIASLRAPGIEAGAVTYKYAWDRFLRRILVFVQRPDATNGSCRSTLLGYYPVPLSVGLTAPIPLKPPRVNRSTPFLCKVYGDAGEGIPGVKVSASAGSSTVAGAPPFTDNDGEAIITLLPQSAGTDTLTITT